MLWNLPILYHAARYDKTMGNQLQGFCPERMKDRMREARKDDLSVKEHNWKWVIPGDVTLNPSVATHFLCDPGEVNQLNSSVPNL